MVELRLIQLPVLFSPYFDSLLAFPFSRHVLIPPCSREVNRGPRISNALCQSSPAAFHLISLSAAYTLHQESAGLIGTTRSCLPSFEDLSSYFLSGNRTLEDKWGSEMILFGCIC